MFSNNTKEEFEPEYFTKFSSTSSLKRKNDCDAILKKYPNRIPVIVDRGSRETPKIDKNKFLCPDNITLSEFQYILRSRIALAKDQAIFLMINGKILKATDDLKIIYNMNKAEDGFLYVLYTIESTFG